METLFLDTHIVVWLREKSLEKFSPKAIEAIENSMQLLISPMVELELKYLFEIGKINDTPYNIIYELDAMIGLKIDTIDFSELIKKSLLLEWTRDPFDRIIVAHTMAKNIKLITKDERISANFKDVLW